MNFVLSLLILLCVNFSFAQQKLTRYQIANKIHVDGEGGWDYITVDQSSSRVYLSHGMITQVLDAPTKAVIATITDTKGVHGIAVAPDLNKGFISNGRDTSVTVFNLKTSQFITKVKVTGINPDAILYDPFSKKVFAYNGKTKNATVIDATTDKVVGTIELSGKPEFSATDSNGKVFVNIEDKNEIAVINATTLKVEQTWSIAPGEEPSGLAIDVKNHRLFAVCGNKMMVIVNYDNGKVVTTVPTGEGTDGVAFDSELKRAYASNGEGTMTVVQEENENTFKVLQNFPTQKGARTIAVNSKTHKIYLPTAEYGEPPAPTAERPHPRPPIKSGTFTILEITVE